MSIADAYAAHVRLAILLRMAEPPEAERRRAELLRLLAALPQQAGTVSLLHDLMADLVPPASRDQVAGDVAWLVEQGLAVAETAAAPGCMLLTRGRDVAAGRAMAPGVAPLATGAWLLDGLHAVQLRVSLADLFAELLFLSEAGCVLAEVSRWRLKPLGLDVARGRAVVPGIQSPSPETALRLAARLAGGMG